MIWAEPATWGPGGGAGEGASRVPSGTWSVTSRSISEMWWATLPSASGVISGSASARQAPAYTFPRRQAVPMFLQEGDGAVAEKPGKAVSGYLMEGRCPGRRSMAPPLSEGRCPLTGVALEVPVVRWYWDWAKDVEGSDTKDGLGLIYCTWVEASVFSTFLHHTAGPRFAWFKSGFSGFKRLKNKKWA